MKTSDSKFAGKILLAKRSEVARDLKQFLSTREGLLAQLKQLDGMIAASRAYLRELDIRAGNVPEDRRLRGPVSIREMTLQVLREAGHPMHVAQIRHTIETKFGRPVERTSISPILSKMAQAKHLHHDADVGWSIPK